MVEPYKQSPAGRLGWLGVHEGGSGDPEDTTAIAKRMYSEDEGILEYSGLRVVPLVPVKKCKLKKDSGGSKLARIFWKMKTDIHLENKYKV